MFSRNHLRDTYAKASQRHGCFFSVMKTGRNARHSLVGGLLLEAVEVLQQLLRGLAALLQQERERKKREIDQLLASVQGRATARWIRTCVANAFMSTEKAPRVCATERAAWSWRNLVTCSILLYEEEGGRLGAGGEDRDLTLGRGFPDALDAGRWTLDPERGRRRSPAPVVVTLDLRADDEDESVKITPWCDAAGRSSACLTPSSSTV
jgi:hypothetical protein